jgi:hypothetical protein
MQNSRFEAAKTDVPAVPCLELFQSIPHLSLETNLALLSHPLITLPSSIAKMLYAFAVPHSGYTCNPSSPPILTTVEELNFHRHKNLKSDTYSALSINRFIYLFTNLVVNSLAHLCLYSSNGELRCYVKTLISILQ